MGHCICSFITTLYLHPFDLRNEHDCFLHYKKNVYSGLVGVQESVTIQGIKMFIIEGVVLLLDGTSLSDTHVLGGIDYLTPLRH